MNPKIVLSIALLLTICACSLPESMKADPNSAERYQAADLNTDQAVEEYLVGRDLDMVEGAWVHDENAFELVIAKNEFEFEPSFDYVGIVTRTAEHAWKRGEIKLLLRKTDSALNFDGVWLTQNRSRQDMKFVFESRNLLQASFKDSDGEPFFVRIRRRNIDIAASRP